jgi:hypothetical protein
MSKKIKKINEFLDDDSRFDFNIDTKEISDEEEKERRDYNNRMTEENIKDFPKITTPNFTIEEYREIMLDLQITDNFQYTQEERDELDNDCMEMYGELFFKKDDSDNE